MPEDCVICGRRGHGVREWGVTMPSGEVWKGKLCAPHSAPLRQLVAKGQRERRRIGAAGLAELVEPDE